jgi:hypothetical protein
MTVKVYDSPLTVRFTRLGHETTLVKEWSIDSAYLVSTDGFSFTLWDPNPANLRGLELQPVELLVNGVTQCFGRIDRTSVGGDGTAVRCDGRDYIADLVECNVDPSLKIKRGQPLAEVITLAASPVGIDTVIADDDVIMGGIRSGKKPKRSGGSGKSRRKKRTGKPFVDFKPEPGQGIYDFLSQIVAREGATIQPGEGRNILVLSEPIFDQEALYSIRRRIGSASGVHNNVVSATADRDYSRFPTFMLMNGTQAIGGKTSANSKHEYDLWTQLEGFNSELGNILLTGATPGRWLPGYMSDRMATGALYRLLNHRDEVARDDDQVKNAAHRAMAERLKDTLAYHVDLRGHTDPETGAIWSVDTMVDVDDDICNIHERLWIAERTLRYSPGEGATTSLVCYRPESFALTEAARSEVPSGGGKKSQPETPWAGVPYREGVVPNQGPTI